MKYTLGLIRTKFLLCLVEIIIDYFASLYYFPIIMENNKHIYIENYAFSGIYETCAEFYGEKATIALRGAVLAGYFLLVKKLCENGATLIDDALSLACFLDRHDIDYLVKHGATECICKNSLESHINICRIK